MCEGEKSDHRPQWGPQATRRLSGVKRRQADWCASDSSAGGWARMPGKKCEHGRQRSKCKECGG
eukprot:2503224-Prymnesium_polylepis.1